MANRLATVQTNDETNTGETNVNDQNTTENIDAAQAAWLATAQACGFATENGEVYGAQGDALYTIPSPVDFDRVPPYLRNFLFFAVAKHGEYRIAQTAKGNINSAVADFVDSLGDWKPQKSMDAFEAVWRNAVERRLRARIDHEDAKTLPATKTYLVRDEVDGRPVLRVVPEKTEGATLLNDTINSTAGGVARDTLRASVIAEAIENGKARGEAGEAAPAKARGGKAAKADMGADML